MLKRTPESSEIPSERQGLIQEIVAMMDQIMRSLKHQFHKSGGVEVFSLTTAQLRGILTLEDRPIHMSGLAEALGVSLPSATGIVDRLVERGLVQRHEDPEDRRLVICELTPKGRDLVACFYEADRAIIQAVLASLTSDELRVILQAFTVLSKAAARHQERHIRQPAAASATLVRPPR